MNKLALMTAGLLCLAAGAETIRDLRLDTPVDSKTIGLAYSTLTNTVAIAAGMSDVNQEALNKAIQVGEDLTLIDADTDGWHIAVSNIVETDQAHVHGVLIVGDTIYGAPERKDRIDILGCDFYYNRQIPGDVTRTNGYGNVVTDPYMDWRLGGFFQEWTNSVNSMWNVFAGIHDLPASLSADLMAYNSITSSLQSASAAVTSAKNEVNATNASFRAYVAAALAEAQTAGGGGGAWTTTTTSSSSFSCSDHTITHCTYSGSSAVTITFPTATGATHFKVFFQSAYDLYQIGSGINYACPGSYYTSDGYNYGGAFYTYDTYGNYVTPTTLLLDIQEVGNGYWHVNWIPGF